AVIWITENARCVRDEAGAILYYEGTVENITRRKRDEEQIRLLAAVFASVGDGILIVDEDLSIRAVNPAYERMTGFAAIDLIGTPLDILAPVHDEKNFFSAAWAELKTREVWSGEAMCRKAEGPPFVAELSVAAVRNSADVTAHYVVTCADISLRKRQ